jgi:hypothetical protein
MIDFIIAAIMYAAITYFFTFVVFMFTMEKRTKLQSFFRFLIFVFAPITAPFYVIYLCRKN